MPEVSLRVLSAYRAQTFRCSPAPQVHHPDEALEWEKDVTELAKEDSEVAEYVKALEESKDATDLPEATGESIARELERFLRRQNEK